MKNHLPSKKKIALVAVLLVVAPILFQYHTASYGYKIPPNTPAVRAKENVFKIVQSLNPFASKLLMRPLGDIPEFDVDLSRRNIKYINGVIARGLDSNKNIYHPAGDFISYGDNNFTEDTKTKIRYKGKTYKGKIKIHGVWYPNFDKKKKSYSIKFKKNQLLDNMRKISFTIPEKQFLGGLMAYDISEKYGYMQAEYGIARLKFNGIDQGLYFYEESLGQELLEKNGLSGYEIVKSMDEWSYQYKLAHYMPYIYDLSYRDYDSITGRDNGQLLLYDELMHSNNFDEIAKRIDLDKFARHEAMRTLFGTYHCIEGDNLALLLNTATGRFFPYFRTEGVVGLLSYSRSFYTFDKKLYGRYLPDGTRQSENILFTTLILNNEFRTLRNRYLNEIVNDSKRILQRIDTLKTKYQKHIENDFTNNFSLPFYQHRTERQSKALAYNLNAISKYLNYARVHVSLVQESAKTLNLNIKPDSNSPLMISKLLIEGLDPDVQLKIVDAHDRSVTSLTVAELTNYFSSKQFMVNLDDQLEPQVTSFDFKLSFQEDVALGTMQLGFINITTGKTVKENNIFSRIVKKPKKFTLKYELSKEKLTASGLKNFSINESAVILHAAHSEVTEDIVFPHGYKVKLEGGVQIDVAPGKSIVVNGSLIVDGSSKPVRVGNLVRGKPFGVFAAVGDGYTVVEIDGFELYGGNEDSIDGMFLSGALSLYNHASVSMVNSHIHHNRADDGLNIKDASIYLAHNIFSNNYADQVDIDVATGSILDNRFLAEYPFEDFNLVQIPVDQNGDGLDFSGSKVLVHGNTFDGFEDKGISVGERTSVVIYANQFERNRSAITAKDQSNVYLCKNDIDNVSNGLILEAYQKKPIFKHPSIFTLCEDIPLKRTRLSTETKLFYLQDAGSTYHDFDPEGFKMGMFSTLKDLDWVLRL